MSRQHIFSAVPAISKTLQPACHANHLLSLCVKPTVKTSKIGSSTSSSLSASQQLPSLLISICSSHCRVNNHPMEGDWLLRVSALHYLARSWESGGFWTVASAHALHQPTSCRSKYFYNQCPQVLNLIGTEHSLKEVSIEF